LKLHHVVLAGGVALALVACRQDMHDQPKHKPFDESVLFKDRRSARPKLPGTVARGHLDEDDHYYRGKIEGKPAESFPARLSTVFGGHGVSWQSAMVARGEERYAIHCTPCHGTLGDGNGMIVQRGMTRPPSMHIERLQKAGPGYYFDVMTVGFGAMFDLADRIKVEDRWAIAAYIRALQLSQNATLAMVPKEYVKDGQIVAPPPAGAPAVDQHGNPPKPR